MSLKFVLLFFACIQPALAENPIHWSFDQTDGDPYPATATTAPLVALRQASPITGIQGQAVSLSRLDALSCDTCSDMIGDGVFAVSFWLKVEWASRRHGHGDVLNFITADPEHPASWRIGFPTTWAQVMPAYPWPLALHIGEFSTAELPIDIQPLRWTHVGFVGDGEKVGVYRNGGLIGYVDYPRDGLPAASQIGGTLQINGSHNFALEDPDKKQGGWECDLHLDELYIGDEPVLAPVDFPAALLSGADTLPRRQKLAGLQANRADRFAIEALICRAELYDNGADTRPELDTLLGRIDRALAAVEAGSKPLEKERGHLKLAYQSPVDQSIQPYEVYIPDSWDGKKPTTLVMALHGSTEDETVYFERYSIEAQAEKYGWIVATPYGRGQRAYRDAGGRDVIDVIEQVKQQWKIDAARVYVTGHSMGGMGCVALVQDYPETFAAVAPVASYAATETMQHLSSTPFCG